MSPSLLEVLPRQARMGFEDNPGNETKETPRPRFPVVITITKVFKFIAAQWLVIGFGLACLLAYFFPRQYCLGHWCGQVF